MTRDIRRYLDILTETPRDALAPMRLDESQDDMAMFKGLLELAAIYDHTFGMDRYIRDQIGWAKGVLKRDDRVIWFLRYARLHFAYDYFMAISSTKKPEVTPELIEKARVYLQKLRAENEKRTGNDASDAHGYESSGAFSQLKTSLEHFMSLPIPAMQEIRFRNQDIDELVGQMRELEERWQAKATETIPYSPDSDGEKVIMTFPDGFAWVMLDRAYCPHEARAMGHCGNKPAANSRQRIVSLRRIVDIAKGEQAWRPSLTFILHEDGFLGEMKGRKNAKPASKYHPYIVALLKSDLIKGIRGGGYVEAAEGIENFAITDLAPETREELVQQKPELGTPADYLRLRGFDEQFKRMVTAALDDALDHELDYHGWVMDGDKPMFAIAAWIDLKNLIDNEGDRKGETAGALAFLNSDHFEYDPVEDEGCANMFDHLPRASRQKIIDHLRLHHADAVEAWEEDNDEDFTIWESDAVVKIGHEVGAITEALRDAAEHGQQSASHERVRTALESAVREFGEDRFDILFGANDQFDTNSPVYAVMTPEKIAMIASSAEEIDSYHGRRGWLRELDPIYCSEPHDGWGRDMSWNDAVSYFLEQNPEFAPEPKEASA